MLRFEPIKVTQTRQPWHARGQLAHRQEAPLQPASTRNSTGRMLFIVWRGRKPSSRLPPNAELGFSPSAVPLVAVVERDVSVAPFLLFLSFTTFVVTQRWVAGIPEPPRAIQSAPSSSAPAGGEVDEVASVSTD